MGDKLESTLRLITDLIIEVEYNCIEIGKGGMERRCDGIKTGYGCIEITYVCIDIEYDRM